MNYMFPIIDHIDDVLPHIEGFDEIIVAEREGYKVINYVVAMPKTFAMDGPGDLGGAIRRECRGLIFNADGKLISRPYHKFKNFGEDKEYTDIDFTQPHIILEKLDGSFIRPVLINGQIRWCTKMGITDVASLAEEFVADKPNYVEFANECIGMKYTPIFEYTSPNNRIVVKYDEERLTLTAVRHNRTGRYLF